MIVRPSSQIRSIPTFLAPALLQPSFQQTRGLRAAAVKVPAPTPFVPDVPTFLSLIGRKLSTHAAKIPSWTALFSLSSEQLKGLGIEPPRTRRYLLRWRQKFRDGQFGIGGDARTVLEGGKVPLRVIEIPAPESKRPSSATHTQGTRRVIVNLAPEAAVDESVINGVQDLKIQGVKLKGVNTIVGSHVLPMKSTDSSDKGGLAVLKVQEGLWEDKRGVVVDGGERRQAAVRAKKRSEERKKARS